MIPHTQNPPEVLKVVIPSANPRPDTFPSEPIGDGGAIFIDDATDEEYEEYIKNEVNGWSKFKQMWEILKK